MGGSGRKRDADKVRPVANAKETRASLTTERAKLPGPGRAAAVGDRSGPTDLEIERVVINLPRACSPHTVGA